MTSFENAKMFEKIIVYGQTKISGNPFEMGCLFLLGNKLIVNA